MLKFLVLMRSLLGFYFGSLPTAVKMSYKWAAAIATGLGILIPLLRTLTKPKPEQEAVMTSLIWQIPVAVFVIFFVLVLLYIPYMKYQGLVEQAKDEERRHEKELGEKKAEISRLQTRNMPEIRVMIKEGFINPFARGADCFLLISLHNLADSPCAIPEVYSLSLAIDGNDYKTDDFLDLQRYYLITYEEVEVYEDDAYEENGRVYQSMHMEDSETGREDVPDIRTKIAELKKGFPVTGGLGFNIRNLPTWPYDEEDLGGEDVEYDPETGEPEYIPRVRRTPSTRSISMIALTVIDAYGQPHSGSITGRFYKYGRRIVKHPKG